MTTCCGRARVKFPFNGHTHKLICGIRCGADCGAAALDYNARPQRSTKYLKSNGKMHSKATGKEMTWSRPMMYVNQCLPQTRSSGPQGVLI